MNDPSSRDTPTKPDRKPGRPAHGERAMTPAERARVYRERRKLAAQKDAPWVGIDAPGGGDSEQVSTPALIDAFRGCVMRHDKKTGLRILRELGRRLIELDDPPPYEDEGED